MRGEHAPWRWSALRRQGSSPHARGARSRTWRSPAGGGIIPACAGSTSCRCSWRSPMGDHPRMRGEHYWQISRPGFGQGSSPHARGAPRGIGAGHDVQGIIPACAGSTSFLGFFAGFGEDHPRMRGEHAKRPREPRGDEGSSPHARGARGDMRGVGAAWRIIPACAGSTSPQAPPRSSGGDHPRMRGEH